MNLIDYINSTIRTADSIDEAMRMIDTMCSATYKTSTPTKDHKILKERFGVDSVLVDDTLVFNVTSEMVDLVENDTIGNVIEQIGLDKNKFEI